MENLFEMDAGITQLALHDDSDKGAPNYIYYGAREMNHDLFKDIGEIEKSSQKQIMTFSKVSTLSKGDIILSITNPKAAIVGDEFDGYLHTRNYMKIIPSDNLDPKYFVFLVNHDRRVRNLLLGDQNMVHIPKTTTAAIKSLQNLKVPPIEEQKLIGEIYFNQMRLSALLEKKKQLEEQRTYEILRRRLYGKN